MKDMKSIITIEIETAKNSVNRTIKVDDKLFYKNETTSESYLELATRNDNMLDILSRIILELYTNADEDWKV